jgi:hypothetical protein
MQGKNVYRYRVTWRGPHIQHYQPCRTWAEACKFMRFLLEEGREGVCVEVWK